MKTIQCKNITQELIESLLGKEILANCRQYSHHNHGSQRKGQFIKDSIGEYHFRANEWYDINDVLEITI